MHRDADVWACLALAFGAAAAALLLPGGSLLRLLTVVPVLVAVPGYLLLEACRGTRLGAKRDALLSFGLSPPVLCLAALATALVPGGFRATPIVAAVTATCCALAAVSLVRRRRNERALSRQTGQATDAALDAAVAADPAGGRLPSGLQPFYARSVVPLQPSAGTRWPIKPR